MRSNKSSGSTIIEVVISLLIVIIGTIGVFTIYNKSQKLSTSVQNRIKAISIAREGIEVIQNIRDTNWVLFSANSQYCWNVKDYDVRCLLDKTYKISPGNYIIYKDAENRWKLFSGTTTGVDYKDPNYRNLYEVGLDSNSLYTQSGIINKIVPLFTRRINISYIDTNGDLSPDQDDEKMLVKSIVSWSDSSKIGFYTITLENLLTNWKED